MAAHTLLRVTLVAVSARYGIRKLGTRMMRTYIAILAPIDDPFSSNNMRLRLCYRNDAKRIFLCAAGGVCATVLVAIVTQAVDCRC